MSSRTSLSVFLFLSLFVGSAARASEAVEPVKSVWRQLRTPSVRVWAAPDVTVGAEELAELENTVQSVGVELGLSPQLLADLRQHPIEYLYTSDPKLVAAGAGMIVDGYAIPDERKIIALRLPHAHEIVHVLAWLAISPAGAVIQPWLQEGLASYLGGHLGEAPLAVLAAGDRSLEARPGMMRGLLTADGFRSSPYPPVDCYAAAARFVQYLDVARGGRPALLHLYSLLAGVEEEVVARPRSAVELQLEGVYGVPITGLLEGFRKWRHDYPVAGIVAVVPPLRAPEVILADHDHVVRFWVEPDAWVISARPLQQVVDLALTWGQRPAEPTAGPASPPNPGGYLLRLDEAGGRLVDRNAPRVLLRWWDESALRGPDGELAWRIPLVALSGVPVPDRATELGLWSQPRFEIDE